jgi:hypothetical protein
MKIVLIDRALLLQLAIPTLLPMLILLVAVTPADQLLRVVLKLLG